MNKLFSILLVLCMVATASAGTQMLIGATTTGPSVPIPVDRELYHTFNCSFLNSTSITAFTAVLQGSIDKKVTWDDLGTNEFDATELSKKHGMMHPVYKSVDYVRINITVATGPDLDADCFYTQATRR